MTAATTAKLYIPLTTLVSVGTTTDLLNDAPLSIGLCVTVGALACAVHLGSLRRVGLCVALAVGCLLGWLVAGDLVGDKLAGHFDEASALNGIVLVAIQYLAALIGAAAGRVVRSRRRGT